MQVMREVGASVAVEVDCWTRSCSVHLELWRGQYGQLDLMTVDQLRWNRHFNEEWKQLRILRTVCFGRNRRRWMFDNDVCSLCSAALLLPQTGEG